MLIMYTDLPRNKTGILPARPIMRLPLARHARLHRDTSRSIAVARRVVTRLMPIVAKGRTTRKKMMLTMKITLSKTAVCERR